LTGLQSCINAAKSCTPSTLTPFCATCALVTSTTGADFNLANPLVAECIYEFARTCGKNLEVGADDFTCSPPSTTPTPCATMFVTYASIDAVVASDLYQQCLSVANVNCLGYTAHPWCAVGGTSLANQDVTSFLLNLQNACNFPLRAIRGTFVFAAGSVDAATVNDQLVSDLQSLTGTTSAQHLFEANNNTVVGTTVTAYVDIFSGVANKSPSSVANYISALLNNPNSDIHNGNVTKHLTSVSFADNYPFTANNEDNLTSGQKAGIVAGVLIFVVFVLIVYQIYAKISKRSGEEQSDTDDDDEDSAVIHQRNQARYAAANKEAQQPQQHAVQSQPVQSQDEAIVAWS